MVAQGLDGSVEVVLTIPEVAAQRDVGLDPHEKLAQRPP